MSPIIRQLDRQDYQTTWQAMQQFTQNRDGDTADEIWVTEHPPVYTLGLNGKPEHLFNTGAIPVINSDRGGQVTYHGPGQIIVYTLLDIKRLNLNIRQLVTVLEQAMIGTLAEFGITANARADAPGVYVDEKKIGSIGLRIKKNCSYHGLSLNNQMDLQPFNNINPCGYPGLQVTQVADLGVNLSNAELAKYLVHAISTALSK
ncbi:MAG: lipoyl(octanoyl) transferase LipB [Methylococcaceae bacterium]|nr:lipoyl(octanoyl) transferase LipB [Methylococcaceae bacterium]MDZ4156875.1 lipoyl(octanoyl) transferase LipB [Methylococcales bacterium]MDP2394077.1 lipoyl(octanoyl) transferase LipB [Methylococcaceae bacterium]MDP3018459.1 lipoyl(octanoyl) transferase LipB [Methylococcaceae bacterium]MDP3392129.1 lipoyl(octanoyl) transferase LipB [Methylococcaceae bacterium]